jgi:hypothetical protein
MLTTHPGKHEYSSYTGVPLDIFSVYIAARMVWKRATHELPGDKEEVLIRDRNQYHLAVYHAPERVFVLRDKSHYEISEDLLWTRLIAP